MEGEKVRRDKKKKISRRISSQRQVYPAEDPESSQSTKLDINDPVYPVYPEPSLSTKFDTRQERIQIKPIFGRSGACRICVTHQKDTLCLCVCKPRAGHKEPLQIFLRSRRRLDDLDNQFKTEFDNWFKEEFKPDGEISDDGEIYLEWCVLILIVCFIFN